MIDYSNEPINEKILKNSITHFDGLITEIQKYDVVSIGLKKLN